jgi:hypothetical protein
MRKLISVLVVAMFIGGCRVDLDTKIVFKQYTGKDNRCIYGLVGNTDAYIEASCDCWDVGDIPMEKWGDRSIGKIKVEAEAKDSSSE